MTQKKLVEAFRAFIQKSVLPLNTTNDVLLNDWKHFNNIISADPIDPNQLDFYLYVINKQPNNSPAFNKIPPERQTTGNISEFGKFSKRGNDFSSGFGMQGGNQVNALMTNSDKTNILQSEKKSTGLTNSTTAATRRKNLVGNLQNFQSLLIKNQQKLQNYNKSSSGIKETSSGFNTSITSNGGTKKILSKGYKDIKQMKIT